MKIKAAELEGCALDWAVAGLVHAEKWRHDKYVGGLLTSMHGYSPSTDWSQGGPLIESHEVWLSNDADDEPQGPWIASIEGVGMEYGPTVLTATCRAIVAAKMGDEVEVPDGLVTV